MAEVAEAARLAEAARTAHSGVGSGPDREPDREPDPESSAWARGWARGWARVWARVWGWRAHPAGSRMPERGTPRRRTGETRRGGTAATPGPNVLRGQAPNEASTTTARPCRPPPCRPADRGRALGRGALDRPAALDPRRPVAGPFARTRSGDHRGRRRHAEGHRRRRRRRVPLVDLHRHQLDPPDRQVRGRPTLPGPIELHRHVVADLHARRPDRHLVGGHSATADEGPDLVRHLPGRGRVDDWGGRHLVLGPGRCSGRGRCQRCRRRCARAARGRQMGDHDNRDCACTGDHRPRGRKAHRAGDPESSSARARRARTSGRAVGR